jgi:Fur family transcriptional regulator, zinc uptake regulator
MNHTHEHTDLTRNQSLVLKALEKSEAPLTAYHILDQLRSKGIKAPLQVYRALEKLVEQGLVHRVESMSAFMACRHQDNPEHGETVFMICETCGDVRECSDEKTAVVLRKLARTEDFALARSSIELRGKCAKC